MQVYALNTLIFLDELKEAKHEEMALKRALAARQEFDVKKVFPQWFPKEEPKSEGLPAGDIANDYDKVEWKSPKDAAEEWERISAMLALGKGFVTGEEVVEMPDTSVIEWQDWQ